MKNLQSFFKSCWIIVIGMALMGLVGCANDFREIPAGYVGKVLTPTGWQNEIRECGQVDIGTKNSNGSYNTLVLLEATSTVVKECFGQEINGDKEDHRIIISKTPVTVDVYVRMMVPVEPKKRIASFGSITPQPMAGQDKMSMITVENIYTRFAKMDARSGIRAVLQKETDPYYISSNIDKFNDKLTAMLVMLFSKNGVPLDMQNVSISNVKMDQTVFDAQNQQMAALAQVSAIKQVGEALRENPQYMLFKKYDTYVAMAKEGKVGTFTIIEGNPGGIVIK